MYEAVEAVHVSVVLSWPVMLLLIQVESTVIVVGYVITILGD